MKILSFFVCKEKEVVSLFMFKEDTQGEEKSCENSSFGFLVSQLLGTFIISTALVFTQFGFSN